MKAIFRFGLTIIASILVSATHAEVQLTDSMVTINTPPPQQLNVAESLVIFNSNTAILTVSKNGLILTLQNVAPYVTKYSSVPEKKAALSLTGDIIQDWLQNKNAFSKSNPAAQLAGLSIYNGKSQKNLLIELSQPKYDAKRATLSFHVKWLGGSPAPSQDISFSNVTLFINDSLGVASNNSSNLLNAIFDYRNYKKGVNA